MKRQVQAKDTEVEKTTQWHQSVFEEGYSIIKVFKATIYLKPEAKPVFRKTRTVPSAMREAITTELDCLERNNIITKVYRLEWATPTMNIPKKDKSVCICGDYKVTLNPMIDMDYYPLPTAEDIFQP